MNAETLAGALVAECERDGSTHDGPRSQGAPLAYAPPPLGTIALGAYTMRVYREVHIEGARLAITGHPTAALLLGELSTALRRVAAAQGVERDHLFYRAAGEIDRLAALEMVFVLSREHGYELAQALTKACRWAVTRTIRPAQGL